MQDIQSPENDFRGKRLKCFVVDDSCYIDTEELQQLLHIADLKVKVSQNLIDVKANGQN